MGYKIAVMGTGAVGAYAGAHMAQAGEDVTFIDPWPENVETMKAKGLKVCVNGCSTRASASARTSSVKLRQMPK